MSLTTLQALKWQIFCILRLHFTTTGRTSDTFIIVGWICTVYCVDFYLNAAYILGFIYSLDCFFGRGLHMELKSFNFQYHFYQYAMLYFFHSEFLSDHPVCLLFCILWTIHDSDKYTGSLIWDIIVNIFLMKPLVCHWISNSLESYKNIWEEIPCS